MAQLSLKSPFRHTIDTQRCRPGRVLLLAVLGAASFSTSALANGAFPAVSQLVADPSDSAHLVLRSNFGLLTTHDQGASWDLLCEGGIGYQNIEPPIAVLDDGVTIAALQSGIAYGAKSECDFSAAAGLTGYMADVARVPGAPHEAVALSVDLNGNESTVWRTLDDGKTWTPWGTPLTDVNGTTLEVAGDARSIYVSGLSLAAGVNGVLAHTVDGGQHWQRHAIAIAGKANAPYIGAVAGNDPDTVYIRLAGSPGRLLATHDAGNLLEPVLDFRGAVDGFALSPDGEFALASSRVDNAAGAGGAAGASDDSPTEAGSSSGGGQNGSRTPHGGCAFGADPGAPGSWAVACYAFLALIRRRKHRVEKPGGRCYSVSGGDQGPCE